jgi:hypothetical protein
MLWHDKEALRTGSRDVAQLNDWVRCNGFLRELHARLVVHGSGWNIQR